MCVMGKRKKGRKKEKERNRILLRTTKTYAKRSRISFFVASKATFLIMMVLVGFVEGGLALRLFCTHTNNHWILTP